jgi:hypothetical protein
MRRREFLALLGSGVAGWPLGVHAQQAGVRIPRLGIIYDTPIWDRVEGPGSRPSDRRGRSAT